MKRSSYLFVVLAFMFLIDTVSAAEPIKLGMVLSVTGRLGFFGEPMKKAAEATVSDINRRGGVLGRPVELFIEDDQSSPMTAVIAATKLIRDLKVAAIIGPTGSDAGMSMIPLCEQEQIPFLVIAPVTSPFRKWVFMPLPEDIKMTESVLTAALSLGAKKMAILNDTGRFGMNGYKNLSELLKQHPEISVIHESFETSDANMIPQLSKIRSANPDLLILYSTGAPAAVVAKNYKQLGMNIPVLCSHGIATREFLNLAGKIAEESKWTMVDGIMLVADKLPSGDPRRKACEDFVKFVEDNGLPQKNFLQVSLSYDGIRLILEAIRNSGTDDRNSIRSALEKIKYQMTIGKIECSESNHQCMPKDQSVMMAVRNGELFPIK
ncbi:MAG: ABC transporter substrate-binding protein [Syntrophorhabdales bacterium]|jgi:branched-chain amino acid transport system substrate-binding protein